METKEHKKAGDQIRIMTFGNRYLKGSVGLNMADENNLRVTMMQQKNGIPVPLKLELSAGDIVALAGDYYTKAGWGLDLDIQEKTDNIVESNKHLFQKKVAPEETSDFYEAYSDLASPAVKKADIDRIYAIENKTYIPFFKSLNSIFQQFIYSRTVKDYGKKLTENEAHFAPWSARAYIVGHNSALDMAHLAYICKKLAENSNKKVPPELRSIVDEIRKFPGEYGFTDECGFTKEQMKDDKKLYAELGNRYHALAVSQDLFAMHFYSDHFAGGHLSRIGTLRESMPKRFGVWGSILINNMHNEDNTRSVEVVNPYQPEGRTHRVYNGDETFSMAPEDNGAYGDGTYFERGNNENSNMLINGMDNSLGDIARLMQTGERRMASEYGGLTFLPEVDYTKRQTQPLLINGPDGNVYFRSDVRNIKTLSPSEYQATLKNPAAHGYEKLTYLKAITLVLNLRVIGTLFPPKNEPLSEERAKKIAAEERHLTETASKQTTVAPTRTVTLNGNITKTENDWRTPQTVSITTNSFLTSSTSKRVTPNHKVEESLSNSYGG